MKKETNLDSTKTMSGRQKFLVVGIITLLAIGALAAMGEFSGKKNGIISNLAETVGLKQKEVNSSETYQPQTGTPQLSKEYVYAGSRMLATEDYGIAPTNPTPTPDLGGGGATPTPTQTPTPTPTPTPPPQLTVNLTASPTSLQTGGVVTVNWSANQTRPNTDYIGLYAVGAPNNSPLSTQNIAGGTSGSLTATMSTAGSFEFRYFVQGNPNPLATSAIVTVTAPCPRQTCPRGYFWNAETCSCEPV